MDAGGRGDFDVTEEQRERIERAIVLGRPLHVTTKAIPHAELAALSQEVSERLALIEARLENLERRRCESRT